MYLFASARVFHSESSINAVKLPAKLFARFQAWKNGNNTPKRLICLTTSFPTYCKAQNLLVHLTS